MFEKNLEKERISWKALWTIYKWGNDSTGEIAQFLQNGGSLEQVMSMFGVEPEIEKIENNIALNEGLQELIDIIIGASGTHTKWDSTDAYLGVGDNSGSESTAQTGLLATTNKLYKGMDSGYPQRTNQTAEWRATFGTSEANFHWQEFTVANAGSDSGKNLNRKVSDQNTKTNSDTWTLSLQITFS